MPRAQHAERESDVAAEAWETLLALATDPERSLPQGNDAAMPGTMDPFLDLYLPCCLPARDRPRVLGHLGQSIDGFIATASGDSSFVNDQENIRHLHRLRALHDAVIVGAGTVAADDPQLTTRRVPGPNPVRVVLDPRRRLPSTCAVFSDGAAPSLLIVAESAGGPATHGQAEVVFAPTTDRGFELRDLIDRLAARGLRKLFVEGGGKTVSAFYNAGLLDRLQIAIAPVLTGTGVPGLRLPAHESMSDCPRPPHRLFGMGQDLLFDWDLGAAGAPAAAEPPTTAHSASVSASIRRIR